MISVLMLPERSQDIIFAHVKVLIGVQGSIS